MHQWEKISSGVPQLDEILGGLYIGDNVIWLDDAGSLASAFCLNFIQSSQSLARPLLYVTFDRSPKNLLDKLGDLANNENLTIVDCFTYGKGAGSEVFRRFFDQGLKDAGCRVIPVKDPFDPENVSDAVYGLHSEMEGDVRFIFESLTGMAKLWGGEDAIANFYSHACPRLYELNTVAYWVMEKQAHSKRLRAQISQIAQVVMDLTIKRGTTSLSILKAENRDPDNHHRPFHYWSRDMDIRFESQRRASGIYNLGQRLRELRTKKGFSQTDLAKMVGVTPSTISQVESNLIYPSVPALMKMAEMLVVDMASFFQTDQDARRKVVFPASEAAETRLASLPKDKGQAWRLTPVDLEGKAEPYLVEIFPKAELESHFLTHKGEEMGYLLEGRLNFKLEKETCQMGPGDTVYLTRESPSQWSNPGNSPARLFWFTLR